MRKRGAVLVFDDDVSKDQITHALLKIGDVLGDSTKRALLEGSLLRTFDPEYGHPVWYVP